MSDNVAITAGAGTSIAADDIAGVKYQRVKLAVGADGSATDAVGGAGAASAAVLRVIHASDDPAVTALAAANASLDNIEAAAADTTTPSPIRDSNLGDYETVAASQTAQVMGASGAAGDFLSHVTIIPATTSPGAVSIKDGPGSDITIFAGGASSVGNLVPFAVPLGLTAATAWKVTTGTNVSAIAVGNFT